MGDVAINEGTFAKRLKLLYKSWKVMRDALKPH